MSQNPEYIWYQNVADIVTQIKTINTQHFYADAVTALLDNFKKAEKADMYSTFLNARNNAIIDHSIPIQDAVAAMQGLVTSSTGLTIQQFTNDNGIYVSPEFAQVSTAVNYPLLPSFVNRFSVRPTHGLSSSIVLTPNTTLPAFFSPNGYSLSFWLKGPNSTGAIIYREGPASGPAMFKLYNGIKSLAVTITTMLGYTLNIASAQIVFDNTWKHVVWTDNHGVYTLYVNGAIDANMQGTYSRGADSLYMGITQSTLFPPLNNTSCLMDEFIIFNTAINQSDVLKIYNNGKPTSPFSYVLNSNIIATYHFDDATFDGAQWNIPDNSGNGHTGICAGNYIVLEPTVP